MRRRQEGGRYSVNKIEHVSDFARWGFNFTYLLVLRDIGRLDVKTPLVSYGLHAQRIFRS
jgi:hypothetical protein